MQKFENIFFKPHVECLEDPSKKSWGALKKKKKHYSWSDNPGRTFIGNSHLALLPQRFFKSPHWMPCGSLRKCSWKNAFRALKYLKKYSLKVLKGSYKNILKKSRLEPSRPWKILLTPSWMPCKHILKKFTIGALRISDKKAFSLEDFCKKILK